MTHRTAVSPETVETFSRMNETQQLDVLGALAKYLPGLGLEVLTVLQDEPCNAGRLIILSELIDQESRV